MLSVQRMQMYWLFLINIIQSCLVRENMSIWLHIMRSLKRKAILFLMRILCLSARKECPQNHLKVTNIF